MSFRDLVLSLVRDIDDPEVRIGIISTFNGIKEAYMAGRLDNESLFRQLYNAIKDLLTILRPDLSEKEISDRASKLAKQMSSLIRLEAMHARTLMRFR